MGRKGDRRLWRFTKRFTMEILIQDFSIGTYREEILYIVGKEMKFP